MCIGRDVLIDHATVYVCVYMHYVCVYVCQFVGRGSSWKTNSFLASQEVSPHFMETGSSFPCSQQPFTFHYPEPDKCSHIFTLYLKSILIRPKSTLRSSKRSFYLQFPTPNLCMLLYPSPSLPTPTSFIMIYLIILIVCGKKYNY
jgi:hypothetical protein